MSSKELGKVDDVRFGLEDHGIMSISIGITFGAARQGFGGIALDDWDEKRHRRIGTAAGMDFVMQILRLFKVETLEELKGRTVYALYKNDRRVGEYIIGLEMPAFDGGERLLLDDWRKEWGYPIKE